MRSSRALGESTTGCWDSSDGSEEPLLHVLVTHLTPFKAVKRRDEVHALIKYMDTFKDKGENLVLMGDLNALSKDDKYLHKHERLTEEVLKKNKKLRMKFLNEQQDAIDYEPLAFLQAAHYVDSGSYPSRGDSTSVPTSVNADEAH